MLNFAEYFYYDESSPTGLRWNTDIRCGKNGNRLRFSRDNVAGNLDDTGYYRVMLKGKNYKVHRIIWVLFYKKLEQCIDHINGIKTDNRINNLRNVSQALNCKNSGLKKNNTSGITGVCLHSRDGKELNWVARWRCQNSGKEKSKSFSIAKYGYNTAFQLAKKHRENMLSTFIQQHGYTERHGK